MLRDITPLIITHDEIANIGRTLEKLEWAERIVVIDSGSTDGTLEVVARNTKVEIFSRPFDTFANQCNFGLAQIATEWVLSLDADYVLSDALVAELSLLRPDANMSGYRIDFVYCVFGRRLSGSLYPPHVALFRKERGAYRDEGHGHRVVVDGDLGRLRGVIFHDDRKPLSRWMAAQRSYAVREADYLLSARREELKFTDRMRLTGWAAVLAVLPYLYLVKWCWRDGRAGWRYALERLFAEAAIALEVQDRRDRRSLPRSAEER
ncbi:MAG: glycosyltransferase family 2 protein [Propylenella sp.]